MTWIEELDNQPSHLRFRRRNPKRTELRERGCLAQGHTAGAWQRQDVNVGLGGDPECAPYPVLWLGLTVLTALLGSPGPGEGWRNHCLAKTISAQGWRLQLGGEAVGQRAAQPAAHTHRAHCPAAPRPRWPGQPCSPPAGLCLPSWASTWALETHRFGCRCQPCP